MSYKRVCRDCPITGCGAKYLVKLSNHLADVHGLSCDDRKKWLQESKLQPVVRVVQYTSSDDHNKELSACVNYEAKTADFDYAPTDKRKRQSSKSSRKTCNRWSPLPF